MSRVNNSFKSITVGALGLFLGYLLNFLTRRIFVQYLSIEYLGLNGLFFNIFSLLTFAELGIGTAITYSLYRPLAFGETETVKILINIFKKTYYTVGTFVLLAGWALTPFLMFLLDSTPDIPHIKVYYMLYILDVGIGYFTSYKRLLLYADQKKYIDSAYRYSFDLIRYTLQIIVLIATHQYFLYLMVVLVLNIVENLIIQRRINRIYPYLKEPVVGKLQKSDARQIKKNVIALMSNKIGFIVVNGTDNLLIVRLIDLASAGIYGGYYMLIMAITKVVGMFQTSILASIGNLVAEKYDEDHHQSFKNLDFFIGWLVGFCSISLFVLMNPFIKLWLGTEYTFSLGVVFVIVLNFYLANMLESVRTFSESMGLFWQNRYKPLFEAAINLIASIWLASQYGILGIFLGTSLSMLLTSSWFEPYVLFQHGLNRSALSYYARFCVNTCITLFIGWVTWKVLELITIGNVFLHFIVAVGVTATLPNAIYVAFFFKRKEFKEVSKLVQTAIRREKVVEGN